MPNTRAAQTLLRARSIRSSINPSKKFDTLSPYGPYLRPVYKPRKKRVLKSKVKKWKKGRGRPKKPYYRRKRK